MKTRTWRVVRKESKKEDALTRWDTAYQLLLPSQTPNPHTPSAEKNNENRHLRPGLLSHTDGETDH